VRGVGGVDSVGLGQRSTPQFIKLKDSRKNYKNTIYRRRL